MSKFESGVEALLWRKPSHTGRLLNFDAIFPKKVKNRFNYVSVTKS